MTTVGEVGMTCLYCQTYEETLKQMKFVAFGNFIKGCKSYKTEMTEDQVFGLVTSHLNE